MDVVSDGTRALEILVRRKYDAVLIDMRLKSRDGIQAIAAIGTLPSKKAGIPVVGLLTETMGDSYERYIAATSDDRRTPEPGREEILATIDGLIADTSPAGGDPASSEGVLDPEVIAGIRQLGAEDATDVVGEVIGLFLDTTPPEMASLLDAIDAGDISGIETFSHKLKTSSANVGAMRLSGILHEILVLAHEGDMEGILSRRDALGVESDRAYRALEEML